MNYDASRNPELVRFYHSSGWKRCRGNKLAAIPWCEAIKPGDTEVCGELAQHVHHKQPIATPDGWNARLDPSGLMSVCIPCHNRVEADGPEFPFVAGTLDLSDDEDYYFDADAGDKPIRFIEKIISHYEGKELIGTPFLLHPVQKKIISEVYGYKHRITGLRRFNRVWWEGAVGCGKSPTLAAIGVFELIDGGEPQTKYFVWRRITARPR